MKILHVIATLDPKGGGPMEGVRLISRAASSWGQITTVVTLDEPGQPFLEGNPFRTVPLGPGLLRYGYSPRLAPWLRENATSFDAIIVNGIWQYCTCAVWRAVRDAGVPYFVFPHGMLDPYFKRAYPLKHLKKTLYWWLMEYRVLRDARAVFFTCEEERLLARQSFSHYRCNEVVVGYGTAPRKLDGASFKDAFLGRFPGLDDKRIVLFLSRIHEKKGCDMLLTAFSTIAGSDPRWHLVMAGPCADDLGRNLRAQAQSLGISDRITWPGMVTGDQKWGALQAAEVFALPSHQENFGIAVAEALACGTPVLISDRVNIWREIVADGAGLCGPDTPEGTNLLLQRWNQLMPEERSKMRGAAQACFAKNFDIHVAARAMTTNIERLANKASARPTFSAAG